MTKLTLRVQDQTTPCEVEGEEVRIRRKLYRCLIEQRGRTYHVIVRGKRYRIELKETGVGKYEVTLDGLPYQVIWEEQRGTFPLARRGPLKRAAAEIAIAAPMPGRIAKIYVSVGDSVQAGDSLLTLEAMKMENAISSHVPGKVCSIRVKEGETVASGQALVIVKEET